MPTTPTYRAVWCTMHDDLFLRNTRLNTPFGYGMRILLPDLPIPKLSIRPSFSYIVAPYSLPLSPPCPIICDVRKSDVPGDMLLNIYTAHLRSIRMDLSVMTELAPRSLLPAEPGHPPPRRKLSVYRWIAGYPYCFDRTHQRQEWCLCHLLRVP